MPDKPSPLGGSHAFSRHPSQRSELERLRRQALAVWPEEERRLARLGLVDGMRVLDIGCGAGFVSEKLAQLNSGGETVGLEPDPALARLARTTFEGRPGLSLHEGSLADNELPRQHFDFAYARFVFQHLATPLEDLRALLGLLRRGGRAVLVDADDGLTVFHPAPPELSQVMGLLAERQANAGGDRYIGRKLAGLLDAAGFTDVGFEVVPFTSHQLGREALLRLAVTSRLIRFQGAVVEEVNEPAQRMSDFFAERKWHGLACVIVAFGDKP